MNAPTASAEDWKRVRDLLRSRAVTPEERASLRRVLADAGQLGSLARIPTTREVQPATREPEEPTR